MYKAPPGVFYMEKLAVGPAAAKVIDLNAPVGENLARIAQALDRPIEDVTVIILDRERHQALVQQVRQAGARIRMIMDGDVAAAMQAATEDYIQAHVYMGIGGATEAVLAAAAIKCIGGQMLCRVWPRSESEREQLKASGVDLERIYGVDDLIRSDDISFAATGITNGELLKGVEYTRGGARTHSVMMRSRTGTIRYIDAFHKWRQQ
jgi:fructose-1,6-bisphosphatase II